MAQKKEFHKYFVWNIDDGLEQDRRIAETLRKYGMGATFNLNSGIYGKKEYNLRIANLGFKDVPADEYDMTKRHLFPSAEHFRLPADDMAEIYDGFEIASHSLTHPNLKKISKEEARKEICEDVKNLSEQFGQEIVGFAYPFGATSKTIKTILKDAGIRYARTVKSDPSFRFPEDPLEMPMTCWDISSKVFERLEVFFQAEPIDDDLLFLMFAHGYEFDYGTKEANWEKFERICREVTSHNDIICCSTGEAFRRHEEG